MITVPPTTDNSGSPDIDTAGPAEPGRSEYVGPAEYVGPVVAVFPVARRVRRHRRGGGVWKTEADRWQPGELDALKTSLTEPDPQPPVDASLADRVRRLGGVFERLAYLRGGERAYRDAGLPSLAARRAGERVDLLDALSGQERDDMLLVAIGRAAPQLRVCGTCRARVGAEETCPDCAAREREDRAVQAYRETGEVERRCAAVVDQVAGDDPGRRAILAGPNGGGAR